MDYNSPKCSHCGHKVKSITSIVPNIKLGQSFMACPMCGKLVSDPVRIEFEFMTEQEQKKCSTNHIVYGQIKVAIVLLLFGITILLGTLAPMISFGTITTLSIIGLIISGGMIVEAINGFITVAKSKNLNIGKQVIYESLLRTSNAKYVDLLKQTYRKDREYNPFPDRTEALNHYKKYTNEEVHKVYEEEFLKVLMLLEAQDDNINTKATKIKNNKDLPQKTENKETEINSTQNNQNENNKTKKQSQKSKLNKEKLIKLKELYDEKLISQEEYDEKRKKIIEKL